MKRLQLGAALLALAGAALIFYFNQGKNAQALPDTAESSTTWLCAACNKEFRLTAAQAAEAAKRAGAPSPLICPACQKKQVYRAAACLTCGRLYFSPDVPGSSGQCTWCFPPEAPSAERAVASAPGSDEKDPPPPSF